MVSHDPSSILIFMTFSSVRRAPQRTHFLFSIKGSRFLHTQFLGANFLVLFFKNRELSCCSFARSYFFKRFSLRFFLFSALSFLVFGFFLELFPIPNSITVLK